MVTIKKSWLILRSLLWLVAGLSLLCGCAPSGPDALLKGERAIREGRFDEAIAHLQMATRLLPKNAQAWNHLALAYHGSQQPAQALKAYRLALSLDYKLAAAHYNLGCLHLEQNEPLAAIEQLTSYTFLQPNSVDGFLKLGDAQLRARRPELAEKSFKTVLELHPRHPEALNGLGIIQLQRRRPQDAYNHFNLALAQNPSYAPALLNLAVVAHQNLYNRSLALQRYRQYLALQPRPANAEAVSLLANELETELNPPELRATHNATASTPGIRIGLAPVLTNVPPRAVSNSNASIIVAAARTNASLMSGQAKSPPPPIPSNATTPLVASRPGGGETARPAPAPVIKPPEFEVTRLPDEFIVRPAQDVPVVSPTAVPKTGADLATQNASTAPASKGDSRTEKRGLLSRINPFAPRSRGATDANSVTSGVEPSAVEQAAPVPASSQPPMPAIERYTYLSPPRPSSGNRREAEKYFAEGVKAQKAGKKSQAAADYEKATQADPAYFEAYYNQGLVAYDSANWKQSLAACELALALQPDSHEARYNFALALKQANYPRDAANELLKILQDNPNEARAHLFLANLCAQQLREPEIAREHYMKLLELEPRHPKAAEIRYWLAANP